jgi:hypothetical protein
MIMGVTSMNIKGKAGKGSLNPLSIIFLEMNGVSTLLSYLSLL